MTALSPIILDEAETFVAVANTPIFLVRRLRENPAARRAHEIHGAGAIYAALEGIAGRAPTTLTDVAEVYLYLVALSFESDLSWLRRARSLTTSQHIKWYRVMADYLLASITPTLTTTFQLSNPTQGGPVIAPNRPRESTANTFTNLRV